MRTIQRPKRSAASMQPLYMTSSGDYSDQIKSYEIGVDVTIVACANRGTPAFAFAFAIAGTPHSSPPGGNSSHMLPVVCGSTHSASVVPTIGGVDPLTHVRPSEAGTET